MTDFVITMQGGDLISNIISNENIETRKECKIEYSSLPLSSLVSEKTIQQNARNIMLAIRGHKYFGYHASEINGIVDRLARNGLYFMSEVSLEDLQSREYKTDDGEIKTTKFFEDDSKTKSILSKLLNIDFSSDEETDRTFIHMHPVGCDHFIAMRLIKKDGEVYIFYINSHADHIAKPNGNRPGTDLSPLSIGKSFKTIKKYIDSLPEGTNIHIVNIDSNIKQLGNWACSLFALNNCDLLRQIPQEKLIEYASLYQDIKKSQNEKCWMVFEKPEGEDRFIELSKFELDRFASAILIERNNTGLYRTKEELIYGVLKKININQDRMVSISECGQKEEVELPRRLKNAPALFFETLSDIIEKDRTISLIETYKSQGIDGLKNEIMNKNFHKVIKNSKFLKVRDNLALTIKWLNQISSENQIADIMPAGSEYMTSFFPKDIFQKEIIPAFLERLAI